MDSLRERALRALGLEYEGDDDNGMDWVSDDDGAMREMPNEAEIIGLLLLELDRLTDSKFFFAPRGWYYNPKFKGYKICVWLNGDCDNPKERRSVGKTPLEALVLAVEAAREGK